MRILFLFLWLFWCGQCSAQIPVEVFVGHAKTSIDIMFFKFFKNLGDKPTPWLFFNRNRAVVDYRMQGNQYLPAFGFTEAVSYNHPQLKGLAPVLVGQILNQGVYAKSGLQYARTRKSSTLFTWLVCELKLKPTVDYFLLYRYSPHLSKQVLGFLQVETVNALPTSSNATFSLTQRLRVGLMHKAFIIGIGGDFSQFGNKSFRNTPNMGIFLRCEF